MSACGLSVDHGVPECEFQAFATAVHRPTTESIVFMSTQPSFGTLFRQSRYARSDADGRSATRQNRQELFAVAGVAFLLKHDPSFRRTFLQRICGMSEAETDHRIEVEVQPDAHADLRIRCQETKALYIVEFKLGAHLQPKQDPAQPEAFFEPDIGYGWTIADAPEYNNCSRRTYIVLQNWRTFQDGDLRGIQTLSRAWKDLVVPPTEESSLTRDLLDTLGGWGIAAMRFRHTTHMKKSEHTKDAADMFQIITAIAEDLGIKAHKFDFDVQPGGDGEAYFGLNIPFGLKSFAKLEKHAGQGEDHLGWFGYSSGEKGASTLDVWIYCKPSKATETPESKTLEFAKKRLGMNFGGSVSNAEGHVRVSIRGDSVSDDNQWFASVFDALRDRTA